MNTFHTEPPHMMPVRKVGLTPGQILRSLAGFFLVCLPLALVASPAGATDSEQFSFTIEGHTASGPNYGPTVWGDDTIGALPIHGEDNGSFSGTLPLDMLNMIMSSAAPSIYVQGKLSDLQRMIEDANGQAGSLVYLEFVNANEVRLLFYGASEITLRRDLFVTGNVHCGTYSGAINGSTSMARFHLDGTPMGMMPIAGGATTELRLHRLAQTDYLTGRSLTADFADARHNDLGSLEFTATQDQVILRQLQ